MNVKIAGVAEVDGRVEIIGGIVTDAPSVEATVEKFEAAGAAIFFAEEATEEDMIQARKDAEESE